MFDDFYNIDTNKFFGIKEFVKVTRNTYIKNSDNHSSEVSFYISSKKMSAQEYNKGIRAHWAVEAMHYVKDVTFREDASLIRTKMLPLTFQLLEISH